MATIVNQMQNDEDQQNQPGTPPAGQTAITPVTGGQSSAIAPTAPVQGAGAPQQKGSGRFTNIQKYVQANQGSGQKMAGDIGKQVGKSQQQLTKTIGGTTAFKNTIESEKNRLNQGLDILGQVKSLVNPEDPNAPEQQNNSFQVGGFTPESAGRPQGEPNAQAQPAAPNLVDQLLSQQDAITKLRTGQSEAGNIEKQSQDLFGTAQQQLGTVQQMADFAKTEPGRFELLRQTYQRPTYTAGQKRLDQVLLQNTGGGQVLNDLQRGLGEQVKTSGEQIKTAQGEIGSGVEQLKDIANSRAIRFNEALSGEQQQLQSNIEARRNAQLASLTDIQNQATQKLANKEALDPNYFTQLGLSPEEAKQAYDNYEAVRNYGNTSIDSARQEVDKRVNALSNTLPSYVEQLSRSVDTAELAEIDRQLKIKQPGYAGQQREQELLRQREVAQNKYNSALGKRTDVIKQLNQLAVDTTGRDFSGLGLDPNDPNQVKTFTDRILPGVTTKYRENLSNLQNRRNEVVGGIDFSQFIRGATPDNLTLQNVANDQDYNKYLALSKLAGSNPTLLTENDRAKAGTGLNAARAKFDQTRANEAIKQILADKIKQSGGEMPSGAAGNEARDLFRSLAAAQGFASGGLLGAGATQIAPIQNIIDSIGGSLGGLFSDKTLKKDIKTPESKDIKEMLDNLNAFSYKYKDKNHGNGKQLGVMAQDLKKSDMGSEMVKGEQGNMQIDKNKAISTLLAAVSDMHDRMKKIEGKR